MDTYIVTVIHTYMRSAKAEDPSHKTKLTAKQKKRELKEVCNVDA